MLFSINLLNRFWPDQNLCSMDYANIKALLSGSLRLNISYLFSEKSYIL